jgi:hypothetical protein
MLGGYARVSCPGYLLHRRYPRSRRSSVIMVHPSQNRELIVFAWTPASAPSALNENEEGWTT